MTPWHYYTLLDLSAPFLEFLSDTEEKPGTLAKGHSHFTSQGKASRSVLQSPSSPKTPLKGTLLGPVALQTPASVKKEEICREKSAEQDFHLWPGLGLYLPHVLLDGKQQATKAPTPIYRLWCEHNLHAGHKPGNWLRLLPHVENRPTQSEADILTELLSRAQACTKLGIVSTVSLSHTLSFPNHSPLAKDSSPGPC